MRIAIASTNENPDSEISNQAGRAPYWLIYENEKLIETWKTHLLSVVVELAGL